VCVCVCVRTASRNRACPYPAVQVKFCVEAAGTAPSSRPAEASTSAEPSDGQTRQQAEALRPVDGDTYLSRHSTKLLKGLQG